MSRLAGIFSFCALVGILASPLTAAPSDPIGSATTVKNQVSAELESDLRTLAIGDNVFQDELIQVGKDSIGELVLNDDTMLALGPGTELKLDRFVYNGERKKGDVLLDIVRGTFRFITGVAEKRSYRIRTPSAAITVRGTIFDVYAPDNGEMWLLLIEGGVQACNDRGDCVGLDKPGMLLRVTKDGDVEEPVFWAGLPGADAIGFATAFPFMVNAPNIDPDPLLSKDDVVKKKASKPKKKKKTYKTKKKKKKKYTKKKTTKPKKKYTKKKKKTKKASSGDSVIPLVIGIGAGIAIGKALKGKKKGGGGHKPPRQPHNY